MKEPKSKTVSKDEQERSKIQSSSVNFLLNSFTNMNKMSKEPLVCPYCGREMIESSGGIVHKNKNIKNCTAVFETKAEYINAKQETEKNALIKPEEVYESAEPEAAENSSSTSLEKSNKKKTDFEEEADKIKVNFVEKEDFYKNLSPDEISQIEALKKTNDKLPSDFIDKARPSEKLDQHKTEITVKEEQYISNREGEAEEASSVEALNTEENRKVNTEKQSGGNFPELKSYKYKKIKGSSGKRVMTDPNKSNNSNDIDYKSNMVNVEKSLDETKENPEISSDYFKYEEKSSVNSYSSNQEKGKDMQKQYEEDDNDKTTLLNQPEEKIRMKRPYLVSVKTKEVIEINKPYFVIGRSVDCDYQIKGIKSVSRKQAAIILKNDSFYLIDLDSSNGTSIVNDNSKKIESFKIPPQTEVEIKDGTNIIFAVKDAEHEFHFN